MELLSQSQQQDRRVNNNDALFSNFITHKYQEDALRIIRTMQEEFY